MLRVKRLAYAKLLKQGSIRILSIFSILRALSAHASILKDRPVCYSTLLLKNGLCVNMGYALFKTLSLKGSKQRMAINNLSLETLSHL